MIVRAVLCGFFGGHIDHHCKSAEFFKNIVYVALVCALAVCNVDSIDSVASAHKYGILGNVLLADEVALKVVDLYLGPVGLCAPSAGGDNKASELGCLAVATVAR